VHLSDGALRTEAAVSRSLARDLPARSTTRISACVPSRVTPNPSPLPQTSCPSIAPEPSGPFRPFSGILARSDGRKISPSFAIPAKATPVSKVTLRNTRGIDIGETSFMPRRCRECRSPEPAKWRGWRGAALRNVAGASRRHRGAGRARRARVPRRGRWRNVRRLPRIERTLEAPVSRLECSTPRPSTRRPPASSSALN
jgi:hypothetical protein